MFGNRSKTRIHPTLATSIDAAFNEHELSVLSRLSTIITLETGTTIITEGTPGREAVVLVSGTAAISRDGEPVAVADAGTILGEASLLTGEARNATVVATSDVQVAALSVRDFDEFLRTCPRVARIVNELLDTRQAA